MYLKSKIFTNHSIIGTFNPNNVPRTLIFRPITITFVSTISRDSGFMLTVKDVRLFSGDFNLLNPNGIPRGGQEP